VLLAFGVTTTATSYVVDTGADVKFTVLRAGATSSTIHLGDLTSVTYKGSEVLAPYSTTSRYSHYEQGLSSSAVISATTDPAGNWIKITCDDSVGGPSGGMIHYYVARKGDNNIYMASLPTDTAASPGEGRFIAYLSRNVFTNPEAPSDTSTTDATVEGSDVFTNSTTGITKSKFYNDRRMIENQVHGVVGKAGVNAVGAWMNMGNREHSAGGPFFKDIDFQSNSAVEIYNCVFTGHTQTEAFRQGLQGPYALQFTNGSVPAAPDYSWMEGVGIQGWIPAAQRGAISGKASGVPAGHEATVALSNSAAQYWTRPDQTTGAYTIAGVQAGTYTETLYDNELAVGTRTVTIAAGRTTRADIVDTYYTPPAIFRIGTWDGTPKEFLHANQINTMHPSDARMGSWSLPVDAASGLPTFTVGTSTNAQWPLAQFKDINNNPRIVFTLTPAQVTALTLRVGLTLAFASGRPNITVNKGQSYAWTSAFQSPSAQPDSRGITRGTWRGNNVVHSFNIPAANLRAGVNTIDLSVLSGETSTGFLSPSVTFDAIDLVTTASLTNAPHVASIVVTPANSVVGPGALKTFTATARDQFGAVIPANVDWSATRGVIDGTGSYTAPATDGSGTVTATVGTVSGATTVRVDATAPKVASAAFTFEASQAVTLTFGEDVMASVQPDDLSIVDVKTGQRVPASQFVLTKAGTTATWTRAASAGALADGNYRATLAAGSVADAVGNAMATDYSLDFYVLAGDANRDRTVDFNDLVRLAQNYNTTGGKTFGDGDFNYDGAVDFNDLVLLAQRYNAGLSASALPALAASFGTTAAKVRTPPRPVSVRPVVRPLRNEPGGVGRTSGRPWPFRTVRA
jgi:rhamnogalacturonan endolyase